VFFYFSLDYFVPALFDFVALGLISSVLCQEIGWKELPSVSFYGCCQLIMLVIMIMRFHVTDMHVINLCLQSHMLF